MKLTRILSIHFSHLLVFCGSCTLAAQDHPQILVTPSDHASMATKVEKVEWAKSAYEQMKERVDHYVSFTEKEADWMTSRLAMNWDQHYTTPHTRDSRWVKGTGNAPVPTPRFAGARDWKTDYAMPAKFEDYKPYNDKEGLIWLKNLETGNGTWVKPSITGHIIEKMNRAIMDLAADAAFVYWVEKEEAYAKFASEILWTYMKGFSYVNHPVIEDNQTSNSSRIIGMQTFEVIHENTTTSIALAYDFCHNYLVKNEYDVSIIQKGLKRMIDRIIEGGGDTGNWNLHQARMIAYGGLSLEANDQYEDGKGRQYYQDVVLNARLPKQKGVFPVVDDNIDAETALWPEAAGYAFHTAADLFQIAIIANDQNSDQDFFSHPIVKRVVPAQKLVIFPDGWSSSLGDTSVTRISAEAAELIIAASRKSGDSESERIHTALLKREIMDGHYDRNAQSGLLALTQYVGELKEVEPYTQSVQTTFAKPLNQVIQRNFSSDPAYSIAASLCGTDGGHAHANGLNLELYGTGMIVGTDFGRGSSYWQPDFNHYYSKPVSHNTVVVDGIASYAKSGEGQIAMTVDAMEPAIGAKGKSSRVNYIEASFEYPKPHAKQQRTVIQVRIDPQTAFFVDIFRSKKVEESDNEFHDYFYHGIGQTASFTDESGTPITFNSSNDLNSSNNLMKGYDFFTGEKSTSMDSNVAASFVIDPLNGTPERTMKLWLAGGDNRQIYSIKNLGTWSFRYTHDHFFKDQPQPAVMIRQQENAWENPFFVVYEPYYDEDGSKIQSIHKLPCAEGTISYEIKGNSGSGTFKVVVFQDAHKGGKNSSDLEVKIYLNDELLETYSGV